MACCSMKPSSYDKDAFSAVAAAKVPTIFAKSVNFTADGWYVRQCVNDWHEDRGVKIDTLDNPGWSLRIDLNGTSLHQKSFQEVRIERSENDWVVARRNGDSFEALGGPENLNDMIESFLDWAE